jgi:purine-cytosine permease-like protein
VRGIYWRKRGIHPPGVIAQLAGMAAAAAWVNTSVWKGPLSTATGGADMSVWMGLGVAGAVYFVLGHASLGQEASKAGHPEAGDEPPLSADAA